MVHRAVTCTSVPSCKEIFARVLTGWVAHDSPFDFAHAPMRYAKSVRRFAQGTPSIPALYSAIPGLEIIESVGSQKSLLNHNAELS